MSFGLFSLLPPVLAIVLALVTRNVIPALFCGVWLGAPCSAVAIRRLALCQLQRLHHSKRGG